MKSVNNSDQKAQSSDSKPRISDNNITKILPKSKSDLDALLECDDSSS